MQTTSSYGQNMPNKVTCYCYGWCSLFSYRTDRWYFWQESMQMGMKENTNSVLVWIETASCTCEVYVTSILRHSRQYWRTNRYNQRTAITYTADRLFIGLVPIAVCTTHYFKFVNLFDSRLLCSLYQSHQGPPNCRRHLHYLLAREGASGIGQKIASARAPTAWMVYFWRGCAPPGTLLGILVYYWFSPSPPPPPPCPPPSKVT